MKDRIKWIAAVVLLVGGSALIAWNLRDQFEGSEQGEEEPEITINDVPPAVQATLKREGAGGTIKDVEKKSSDDGKTVYEASITVSGRKVELEVAEDGSVLDRKVKAQKL